MPISPREHPPLLDRIPVRFALAGLLALAGWLIVDRAVVDRRPIVVGLLHSRTGPDAAFEKPMLDAEIAALSELNADGGVLGRPVRWVVADGASDPQSFARQAARLIRDEGACVLLGCWRTTGRKSVLRVVEANDHLLVFPGRYEGLEQSPNIVYVGPVASQFIGPGVRWLREDRGARRFFLVGQDDLWGRSVEAIAGDLLEGLGCTIAGRAKIAGSDDVVTAAAAILTGRPDAVICAADWPAAASLSRALRSGGLRPDATPLLVLPFASAALPSGESVAGITTVVAAPHSLAEGRSGTIGDEAAAGAATAVRLWAQAVSDADTTDVRQVRDALRFQSLATADGTVAIDPDTQHAWHRTTVVRLRADGLGEEVAAARPTPLRPTPFPGTRSRSQWEQFTSALLRRWGGSWSPPAEAAAPPAPLSPGDSSPAARGAPR